MLEVEVANHDADFVRDGFDLAIRMGTIDEPGLVARKLGVLGDFTSPRYLASRCARGVPKRVDDLASHETIAFMMPTCKSSCPRPGEVIVTHQRC